MDNLKSMSPGCYPDVDPAVDSVTRRTNYDYHFATEKLQQSICERDLGVDVVPSLSLEHHMKKTVEEVNYLLVNIKTALKYRDPYPCI